MSVLRWNRIPKAMVSNHLSGPKGGDPNASIRRALTERSHCGTMAAALDARCQPQGDSQLLRGASACSERYGPLVSSHQTGGLV